MHIAAARITRAIADMNVSARPLQQHVGEILTPHHGRAVTLHGCFTNQGRRRIAKRGGFLRRIDGGGGDFLEGDLGGRIKGRGSTLHYGAHAVFHQAHHLHLEGAHCALQRHLIWDHIIGLAGIEAGHAQHGAIQGGHIARDHALQSRHDLRTHHNGINRLFRPRAMAALALDHDVEKNRAGHDRAWADGELPNRQAGAVMQPIDRIAGEAIKQPIRQHGLSAAAPFFRRLENEMHRAVEIACFGQITRGGQQHGGMPIMPTAMHLALNAGFMREAIGFRHGQRIHIRAQPKPALAVPVPQHAHNAGLANAAMHLNPPGSEAFGHQRAGPHFLKPQFRMGMEIAPPGGEFFMPFADFLDRCHAAYPQGHASNEKTIGQRRALGYASGQGPRSWPKTRRIPCTQPAACCYPPCLPLPLSGTHRPKTPSPIAPCATSCLSRPVG